MRKIESAIEKEKKEKKRQWSMGIVLIIIMVGSIAGYASYEFGTKTDTSQKINYKGLKFERVNGYWTATINGASYSFLYSPQQMKNKNLNVNTIESYYSQPLYVSSSSFEAQQEIGRNLYNVASSFQEACLKGENCSDDKLPIKDCSSNFIVIREGKESVVQSGKCVYITGDYSNLSLLSDEFLFRVLKL